MSDSLVISTYQVVVDRLATQGLALYMPASSDYLYITEEEFGYIAKCSTIAEVEMFLNGIDYKQKPK